MGQSGRHYLMCKALYEILRAAAGDENTVSCDAFVYFNAANPERKLAPDGAIKLGVPHHVFDPWKSWERGPPELAFEILSPSDSPEARLREAERRIAELEASRQQRRREAALGSWLAQHHQAP